jgi:chemotaxis protein CheC
MEWMGATDEELFLDAMAEAGNMGAGHASSALSSFINLDVLISITDCRVASARDAAHVFDDLEEVMVSVRLDASGAERGEMLIFFSFELAMLISERVCGRQRDSLYSFDEEDKEAVAEAGNICASAYLNAMAKLLDNVMLPSPPEVRIGQAGELFANGLAYPGESAILLVTDMIVQGKSYVGLFLYYPDGASQQAVLARFGVGRGS